MKYTLVGLFLSQFVALHLFAMTLGIIPQQSPFHMMVVWNPIVKYLEKETGEKVVLKLTHTFSKFENVLYSGGYDIVYLSPYHYVIAHKKQGYTAEVRAKKNIVGILVVNKNSGITNIAQTKGKTFLFPAAHAFGATLLTKYELLKQYNINVNAGKRLHYVNSHDSVYKGIARGIGDVGGGIERTFDNLNDKKTKNSLIILYKTPTYPCHPFAFKPSIPKNVKEQFLKALLNMPKNLLDKLSMKQIIRTNDSQYDVVRDLVKKLSLRND